MKRITTILLFLLLYIGGHGQTLSPKVTPTSGGYSSGGGNTLSWTMGETHTITLQNGNMLTQGEQQPEIDLLTGSISGSPYCSGIYVSIPYTAIGYYGGANVFTAQLSNSSGSFASPVNIGSLSSTGSGIITAFIPSNTPSGNGYRIRVISNAPVFIGKDNGSDLIINTSPTPSITPNGPTTFCNGGNVILDAGSYSGYYWSNSTSAETITVTVSGNYSVTVTDGNMCTGVVSQIVTVNDTPAQPGTINGNTPTCQGNIETYYIDPVSGATDYTWTLPSGWNGSSTTTSITTTVGNVNGNISVIANNDCGSSSAAILAINVNSGVPSQPGAITGNTNICSNSNQTYSIASVTGATNYTWTFPSGWIGTSTTNSITTTIGSSSGDISVTANNLCGTSLAQTLSVTVITIPDQPGAITGNTSVCGNSSKTYSIASVTGATSYSWTLPSGWSGSSTSNSITTTIGTASGSVSVTANNNCGSSLSQTLFVTVNSVPFQPGSITGNTSVCHSSSQTYSVVSVSGATSYTWTLPSGWTGTSTTTNINTTVGSSSGNVSVTANNACGSSVATNLTVTVNPGAPPQPGVITGNTSVCHGTSQSYSIAAVNGATSYIWTLPSGWTGTSTTTNITVTVGNSAGNITVKASNGCGNSPQSTLSVTMNGHPNQPGVISGNTAVCGGTTQVYSIASVTGATSYTWTLPSGWTGTSTTTSVTVTTGNAGGTISVNADNTCGNSINRNLSVSITPLPATPGIISGNNSVCSGTTQTYSIAAVSGATSYVWALPSGWTGSSTTTSITATVGTTGGNVSVLSVNNCGISNTSRTIAVSVISAPAQPGNISGNVSPCQGTSQTYFVNAVAGASGYTWTLPSGWSGTSTTASITTTIGASGGNISVIAHNNCGTSNPNTLAVNVNTIPSQPGVISGNISVCQGTMQTYSITPVSGATSYVWTKPTGWTGTSTTTSISVTVNATSGNVTVKAMNSCGSSPVQTLAVTAHSITAVTISGNPNNFNFCTQISPTNVIMTASSGYTSYIWSPSGGSSQTATVSSVNTYVVTATNAAGCATTASKTVTNNCALPTNLNTTNILGTSAKATWTESQCRYNYFIRISVHGLNTWTQHTISPTNNYTFTGLSLSTTYDWQIQTNCNTSGTVNSGWTAIQTFTTAASRMAEEGNSNLAFNIYPNPADAMVTIAFTSMEEGTYSIKLIDMLGRTIKSDVDNAIIGDNAYIMNLDGIAKGVYMIVLQKGDELLKSKLLVE